jgi:hypothetical protein
MLLRELQGWRRERCIVERFLRTYLRKVFGVFYDEYTNPRLFQTFMVVFIVDNSNLMRELYIMSSCLPVFPAV